MLRILTICLFFVGVPQVHAQSLVGKWDCDGREGNGTAAKAVMQFTSAKRYNHYLSMGIGGRKGRVGAVVNVRGTWKLVGDDLVETASRVKTTRIERGNREITNTPLGRQLAAGLSDRILRNTRVSRTKLQFLKSGKIRIIARSVTITCTRR